MKYNNKIKKNQISIPMVQNKLKALNLHKSVVIEKDMRLSNFNINTQHNKILRLFLNKLSSSSFSYSLQNKGAKQNSSNAFHIAKATESSFASSGGRARNINLINSPAIRSITAFQEQELLANKYKVLYQKNKYLPSLFINSSLNLKQIENENALNLKNNNDGKTSYSTSEALHTATLWLLNNKKEETSAKRVSNKSPMLSTSASPSKAASTAAASSAALQHGQPLNSKEKISAKLSFGVVPSPSFLASTDGRTATQPSHNSKLRDPLALQSAALYFNIDKRILPFFSSHILAKKISDQKKNKNLLNPQKKLIYKIIKLNEKLIRLTTSIKKYNLNLNSFKGNKSDFILFIRNNLYYNLKFRLSNILYKIEKFIPILKCNSLLNNINLFVPKRLLKPQPYIRFTYRMRGINNIFNINSLDSQANDNPKANIILNPLKVSDMLNNGKLKSIVIKKEHVINPFSSSSSATAEIRGSSNAEKHDKHNSKQKTKLMLTLLLAEENGRAINYILLKLNNLLKDIDYIINIKNKLIKIFKVRNINNLGASSSAPQRIAELAEQENSKRGAGIAAASSAHALNSQTKQPSYAGGKQVKEKSNNSTVNPLNNILSSDSWEAKGKTKLLISEQGNILKYDNKLLLKNSNNLCNFSLSKAQDSFGHVLCEASGARGNVVVTENKIKIKETIKSITNNTSTYIVKSNTSSLAAKLVCSSSPSFAPVAPCGARGARGANSVLRTAATASATSAAFHEQLPRIAKQDNFGQQQSLPMLGRGSQQNFQKAQQQQQIKTDIISPINYNNINNNNKKILNSLNSLYLLLAKRGNANALSTAGKALNAAVEDLQQPKVNKTPNKSIFKNFDSKLDPISVNSNPVDLLYFNNNLNKPIINQYLNSMSIYNMITNGTILYYSNIIAFNFKKRVKEYLPFYKPKLIGNNFSLSNYNTSFSSEDVQSMQSMQSILQTGAVQSKLESSKARNASPYFLATTDGRTGSRSATAASSASLASRPSQNAKQEKKASSALHGQHQTLGGQQTLTAESKARAQQDKSRNFKLDKKRIPFGIFGRGIENNRLIKNIYKFLYLSFKSMYCLISKPVFIIKSNKIIIQLFYFLLIPRILKSKKKKTFYYFKKSSASASRSATTASSKNKKDQAKQRQQKGYTIINSLNNKKINSFFPLATQSSAQRLNPANIREQDRRSLPINSGVAERERDKNNILRKTNFNYNNKFNRFLLNKFLNSKRLSKIIIPNAKLLATLRTATKLGIPQWKFAYSGENKKGILSWIITGGMETKLNKDKNLPLYFNESLALQSATPSLSSTTLLQSMQNQKNIPFNESAERGVYHWGGIANEYGDSWKDKTWPFSLLDSKKKNQNLPSATAKHERTKRFQLIKLANINLIKLYPLKFEKMCEVLNRIFNKPVELDLIRLHYPYNDSNILVRLLAFMINKIKLRRITRKLFKNAVIKSIKKINNKDQVNIIPAFLSGMTIKIGGRLMKYKVIPRKTVKIIRRGSSSIGKINYSDFSRYTNKNKRGAFTITIKSGQNFFM